MPRGCLKRTDLTGHKYGWLTVTAFHAKDKWGKTMWKCKCICGNYSNVRCSQLTNGGISSCGCKVSETNRIMNTTHGHAGKIDSPEYRIWSGMKTRCLNKKDPAFVDYGGRGIKICERWMRFENFFADMGNKPLGLSLNRINNDGDYCPENCEWATRKQQMNNTRNNRIITAFGQTMTLSQWCEKVGMRFDTIWRRLQKSSPEIALTSKHYAKLVKI